MAGKFVIVELAVPFSQLYINLNFIIDKSINTQYIILKKSIYERVNPPKAQQTSSPLVNCLYLYNLRKLDRQGSKKGKMSCNKRNS